MRYSKIITEHSPECKAKHWVAKNEVPFEWNVIRIGRVIGKYNDELEEVTDPSNFISAFCYVLNCGDDNCPGRKLINAKALGYL